MKPRRMNRTPISIRQGMRRSQVKRVAKRFRSLHKELDKATKTAEGKFDISCSEGCSACCKRAVTLSVLETFAFLEPLLFDPVKRPWFLSRYPKIEQQAKDCIAERINLQTWFDQEIPCVFLKEDRCSIYENRPAACRTHLVISPSEMCAPPRVGLISKVNIVNWLEASMYECSRAARETGITEQIVPLPVAVAWAITAIEKGADALGKELQKSRIFGDDSLACLWWAVRFTQKESWERQRDAMLKETSDE